MTGMNYPIVPPSHITNDAQPAPEPVKDDLPLTEVVAKLRAIVADHGGLMHEIEPVDAILCPDCGANLAAEHHKSGWCPSVGVLPRSSADNAVDALNALASCEEADITSLLEQLNHNPTIDAYRRKVKAFRSQIIQLAARTEPQTAVMEALDECIATLKLVEHPSRVDPQYGEEVKRLGDRIGYGALMSSASASWREKLASDGYPVGGEFVAGPCHGSVLMALKKARAALAVSRPQSGSGK